jgi:hypothetical protein
MQKNLTFEQRTQRIEAWLSDFIELLDAPFAIRQDSNKQGRELSDILHGEQYAQEVIQELDQSHMISALDLAEERSSPPTPRKDRKSIEDIIAEAANK